MLLTLASVLPVPAAGTPGSELEIALYSGHGDGQDQMFLGAESTWVGGRIGGRAAVGRVEVGLDVATYALQYETLTCEFGGTCEAGRFVPFFPVYRPSVWGRLEVVQTAWLHVSPWVLVEANAEAGEDPGFDPTGAIGVSTAIGGPKLAFTAAVPAVGVDRDGARWPVEQARLGGRGRVGPHQIDLEVGWLYAAAGYTYAWERFDVGARWATAGRLGNTAELTLGWRPG